MKNIRIIAVMVAVLLLSTSTFSQSVSHPPVNHYNTTSNDIRLRLGFEIEKTLYKNMSLTWEEEFRFKDDISKLDRIYSSLTVSNRFNKYFKLGAGYTLMNIWHDGKKKSSYNKYWDNRHRANLDIVGNLYCGQWKFTLRERPMVTFRTDDPNTMEKADPEFLLRSKFQAEYSLRKKPLKPYVAVELSNTLNAPELTGGNYIDRVRTNIGVKYRINRRNAIDFFYRFDVGTNKDVEIDYKKDKVTIKSIDITKERDYTNIIGVIYSFGW